MDETYNQLSEEDRNWLNELKFFEEEIGYFNTKLSHVESDPTTEETVNGFKKRFSDMLQTIKTLRNLILKSEKHLADRMELAHRMNVTVSEDHHSLKQLMVSFSQQYKSLKSKVNHFLSEVSTQ